MIILFPNYSLPHLSNNNVKNENAPFFVEVDVGDGGGVEKEPYNEKHKGE